MRLTTKQEQIASKRQTWLADEEPELIVQKGGQLFFANGLFEWVKTMSKLQYCMPAKSGRDAW